MVSTQDSRVAALKESCNAAATGAAPFPGLWLTDAAAYVPVPQLVAGVLPAGCSAAIAGPPGSGKSTLAIDVALHVAAGNPWQGRRVTAGSVMYCGLEGAAGLQARLKAAITREPDLQAGRFRLVPGPVHLVHDIERLLATAAEVAEVGAVGLVVIDTLARATSGLDENSGQDMSRVIAAVDRLRAATGACVLLVHHTGKLVDKGLRGHSSLLAALDVEILVTNGATRTAEITKSRDAETGRQFAFTLEPVTVGVDDSGAPVTACVPTYCDPPVKATRVPTGKNIDKLRSAITEWRRTATAPVLTRQVLNELAEAQGIKPRRVGEVISSLVRHMFLTPSVGGWKVNTDG